MVPHVSNLVNLRILLFEQSLQVLQLINIGQDCIFFILGHEFHEIVEICGFVSAILSDESDELAHIHQLEFLGVTIE